MEAFYALLIRSGKYTFLPELYDIFGRESTIKFLEIFSGCKISVPSVKRLEELARDAAVYLRIESASPKQQSAIVKTLADEYDLTEDRIRRIYAHTKVELEDRLGFKAIRRG